MWTIEQVLNALELSDRAVVVNSVTSGQAVGVLYFVDTLLSGDEWARHIERIRPRHVTKQHSTISISLSVNGQPICIASYETSPFQMLRKRITIEVLKSSASTVHIARLYDVFGGVEIVQNEMDTVGEIRAPLFEAFIDTLKVKF